MAYPKAAVPSSWQRNINHARVPSGKLYSKGSGKNRGKVERGPGGEGKVISSTSDSCFSKGKA